MKKACRQKVPVKDLPVKCPLMKAGWRHLRSLEKTSGLLRGPRADLLPDPKISARLKVGPRAPVADLSALQWI